MEVTYFFIIGTMSIFIFSIVFKKSKVFVPLQNLMRKSKRKGLYDSITLIASIVIVIKINDFFNLGVIGQGIIGGLVFALNNIIFEKNINGNTKKSKAIWKD